MHIEESGVHHQWFALRVKPHCEKLVSTILRNKGYEEFLPLYRLRRRWSDRFKLVELPLFPGYEFCRLDPQYRLAVLTTPGVLHFVSIGRIPAPIDDREIAAIQTAACSGLSPEPWPFLEVGQRVQLEDGPLSGLEGFLIEARKQHRIVVSVTLLRRSIAVEIDRNWVRPLDRIQRDTPSPSKPALAAGASTDPEYDSLTSSPVK